VHFRISDVFLGRSEEQAGDSPVDSEAEGRIVGFSDSGSNPRAYAVVELDGGQRWIIPVEKISPVSPEAAPGTER